MTSPAGWHSDPHSRHQYRYWDGTRWTEHVADGGQSGIDDPLSAVPTSSSISKNSGFRRGERTINGGPQRTPEGPGVIQRRTRMFVECARRLEQDPLASPGSVGRPIGDGQGLEGLVSLISPIFANEPSLIRWVALRGALTELHIRVLDPTSAARTPSDLESAMGLEWARDAGGDSHPDLIEPWRSSLSSEDRQAALGIASSVLTHAEDYPRLSALSVDDVNADARLRLVGRAVALDIITWSAIALLRLEVAQQLFPQVPEPDAMPAAGWYTEALFAKSERYWDGSDWTDKCRVPDGRKFRESSVSLG